MPYSRRIPKVDIRNLHIDTTSKPPARTSDTSKKTEQPALSMPVWHNPAAELKVIALCGIPLILLIIVASIFDYHKGWVIPLAEWLMSR